MQLVETRTIFSYIARRSVKNGKIGKAQERGGKGRKSPVGGSVLGTTIIPVDDVGTRVIGGRKDRMQRRGKNGWNERGHGM